MNGPMDALKRRVMGMIGRAVLEAVNDGEGVQLVQISAMADELHDNVERFQSYGLTSHPHPGGEGVIVFAQGTRSHGLVIAIENRQYRLKALEQGEVALYDDLGQVIHLKRDQILLQSPNKVTIDAPDVVVTAETALIDAAAVNLGGEGGPAVARIGDAVEGGVIVEGSSVVFAA